MGTGKAVFLLQTDPWWPKPVLRALREADALRQAGWDVSFVSWIKGGLSPSGETPPFPVRRVVMPVPPLGTSITARGLAYLRASRQLRDAALAESPDLLVAHDFEVLSAAVAAGRRARIPIIYDSHEDWPALIAENSAAEARVAKLQETRLCRHVAHVVTVSEAIAARFRAMGKPTTVLYNARPTAEIKSADRVASREEFRYAPSDFVVGFAGAIVAGRGLDVLLDALERLPEDVKALLVGGPEDEAIHLRAHAASIGIQNRVRIDGYRPFGQLAPSYACMDLGVILLDRRPNHERALPNKLFDYMAHEVAVLVPDYPAMASLVRTEGAGWVVPDSEPAAVAATVDIARRSGESSQRGQKGRDAYLKRYSWDRQAEKFLLIVSSQKTR